MTEVFTGIGIKIQGHLKILEYKDQQDYQAGRANRVLLNKRNAVHKDNASIMLINALTKRINTAALHTGSVSFMFFGNGGTTIDSSGTVIFNTPNDEGADADLYNPIYFQMVDDNRGSLPGNQMAARHISNSMFTDIDIRCLVGINEPFGQLGSNMVDGINLNTNPFSFDEIGLKTTDGDLVTHVIFTPVLKTASSLIEVVYTLRVMVAEGSASPVFVTPVELEGQEASTEIGEFEIDGVVPAGFAARAVEFDGFTSLWDLPAMTDSSTGTLSCWVYLPPNFGSIPFAGGCDFFNVVGGVSYLLTAEQGLPLYMQCGFATQFFYLVSNITNNTANAVITLTSPGQISGIPDIGTSILLDGIIQLGWTAGTAPGGRKTVNVISRTATTITTDFDTTGYPAWNPVSNPSAKVDIGYITTISNTNPAVITTSLPHGIDGTAQPFVSVQGLTGAWSFFALSPVQVLSTTANTITINADATARGAFVATSHFPRIYVLNSVSIDFSDHAAGVGPFYNWQNVTAIPGSQWVNLLISWDMNHASGSKIAQVYYGDTATTTNWIEDDYPAFSIPYSLGQPSPLLDDGNAWKVAGNGDTNGSGCNGYMSEFWFAPGVFLDFSDAANRHKFHDAATGKAISLGSDGSLPTGSPPQLYLSLNNGNSTTPDPSIIFVDPLGQTLEQNPGILGGIADSPTMVLSFWIDRNTKLQDLFVSNSGAGISITGNHSLLPPTIRIEVNDASFNRFTFEFEYEAGTGANIAVALDANQLIGSKTTLVYVNNQPVSTTIIHDEADNLMVHWQDGVSSFQVTAGAVGYIGDIWFAPGQFFDPINKFSDNFGNPVAVGANGQIPSGTSPTIFLSLNSGDPVSDFGINKGTGGDFTGAGSFLLENGTRFSDNESGTGHLRVTLNRMILAPTSPTD